MGVAFVRNPRQLVDRLARQIKPGGTVAIHEYFDYGTWKAVPPSSELTRFVGAVIRTWRDSGGEPNVGLMLPRWLEDGGFRILRLRPLIDIVDSAQPKWDWLQAFVDSGSRRLESLGDMSVTEAEHLRALAVSWSAHTPSVRLVTPAVVEIVAIRT